MVVPRQDVRDDYLTVSATGVVRIRKDAQVRGWRDACCTSCVDGTRQSDVACCRAALGTNAAVAHGAYFMHKPFQFTHSVPLAG